MMRHTGFFVLLLLAGCGPKAAAPLAASAAAQTNGEYSASLSVPPALGTGDQTLTFSLTEAKDGLPVGDANVSASAVMLSPRLPAAAVSGRAQGNGMYQLPLRFGVATLYSVQVTVRRPGHTDAQFSFPVTAGG